MLASDVGGDERLFVVFAAGEFLAFDRWVVEAVEEFDEILGVERLAD